MNEETTMGTRWAIIVHGGAGRLRRTEPTRVLEGVRQAMEVGKAILEQGGSAMDACERAVQVLEDNPTFNAGTGSVLTLDGRCEMDASMMRGSTLEVGAVAAVRDLRHPISLARAVLEHSDHVLLSGEGAMQFARMLGFEPYDPVTEERRQQWKKLRDKLRQGEYPRWAQKMKALLQEHPELFHGTVGCVALDEQGEVVAGTSTGGIFLKLFGRIGDTPIPGAGTYATPAGGASATGIGEGIMRVLLAYQVVEAMAQGIPAPEAARKAVRMLRDRVGLEAGVIAIDREGRIGFEHFSESMPVAYATAEAPEGEVRLASETRILPEGADPSLM